MYVTVTQPPIPLDLDDLIQYFGQYGVISSVSIKYNAVTGNPRGFGFITFASDGSIDAVRYSNCPITNKRS